MTKTEAVKKIVSTFVVKAKITNYDYDPAGSTTEWIPDPADISLLETLLGRTVSESDLYFSVGGYSTHFIIKQELIDEISI